MKPWDHPWASVAFVGISESDPTCEVLLWLKVGVPVVLVKRELLRIFGFLIDSLIPIKAHILTDQI